AKDNRAGAPVETRQEQDNIDALHPEEIMKLRKEEASAKSDTRHPSVTPVDAIKDPRLKALVDRELEKMRKDYVASNGSRAAAPFLFGDYARFRPAIAEGAG